VGLRDGRQRARDARRGLTPSGRRPASGSIR
jgi:hypothetical protein